MYICVYVYVYLSLFIRERTLISVICDLFFNFRQLENKISANLSFKLVMVPLSEKMNHLTRAGWEMFAPALTPTPCTTFSLLFVFLSSNLKNNSLCPRKEGWWVLFPNISIINQSFSKIQWSLQNFPLNQLPQRIGKVLGAKFQMVSCRFQ